MKIFFKLNIGLFNIKSGNKLYEEHVMGDKNDIQDTSKYQLKILRVPF